MRPHRIGKAAAAVGFGAALALSWTGAANAAPKYYFRLDKVESSAPLDGGTREFAKEALGAELASRSEWASDLGGATTEEAIAAELKRRNLRGFNVRLKIAELKKDLKEGRTSSRFKKLSVGVRLEVLGITLPGEKLAFSGTGETAAETEVSETRLDKETELLTQEVIKGAIKQAVDQAVLKLGVGKSAPMKESRRKGAAK